MQISIKATRHSTKINQLCRQRAYGVTHSVFDHAHNLIIQNELFSVLVIEKGNFPNAIIIKPSQINSLLSLSLKPNLCVRFNKTCVILSDRLHIDLSSSMIYADQKIIPNEILSILDIQKNLCIATTEGDIQAKKEGLGVFWKVITPLLSDTPVDTNNFLAFQKKSHSLLIGLVHGLRERNFDLIRSAISELSGLGIGLTPSGDDLLTGLVAAFTLFGSKTIHRDYYSNIADLILISSKGKTNTIAYQMLLSATRQEITSELANYITSIAAAKTIPIGAATRLLFSYGHSSGAEMGLGAYLGIALVNEARTLQLV